MIMWKIQFKPSETERKYCAILPTMKGNYSAADIISTPELQGYKSKK